jgi:ribosomal protein S8
MTDPISDLIIRIKNANLARHSEVTAPHSKMAEVVKILPLIIIWPVTR